MYILRQLPPSLDVGQVQKAASTFIDLGKGDDGIFGSRRGELPEIAEQVDLLFATDQRRCNGAERSNRLSAALTPSTCHAETFSAKPLRVAVSRSR
jgi:hypothetical protein